MRQPTERECGEAFNRLLVESGAHMGSEPFVLFGALMNKIEQLEARLDRLTKPKIIPATSIPKREVR